MKKHNFRGGVALTALLVCSFAAILMAGWSYTLTSADNHQPYIPGTDSMGYHPVSVSPYWGKTWWVTEKDASGADKRLFELVRRYKNDFKLDLPNVGVKDPKDIIWPYKDGFTYELVQGAYAGYSTYPEKGTMISTYAIGEESGSLSEVFDYWPKGKPYGNLRMSTVNEFDENRKATYVNLNAVDIPPFGNTVLMEQPKYEISMKNKDGKLHWVTTKSNYVNGKYEAKEVQNKTIDAPEDGFYFYVGSETPGQIALLLSVLELDGEEPASVWVLAGGNLAIWNTQYDDLSAAKPIFTRMTAYPLDKAPSWLRKWWVASRKFYEGWKPGELRTYILYEEGNNYYATYERDEEKAVQFYLMYLNGADIVVAYLDDKDRLVRVEQVGASYCTAAQLKKIGTNDKWWGN